MATDWLFYWMTLPSGLAGIALAVGLPFLFWRLLLAKTFGAIGYKPLAVGYSFAALGLVTTNFASTYLEFNSRVSKHILSEAERWSTVPGWTVYLTVLSLIYALPLIGLLGVPVSAILLRLRRLTYTNIAILVIVFWCGLALAAWASPTNEWHRTHRLESLTLWMTEIAPGALLVALPFLLGIYSTSRPFRQASA
jgi:hypothetical protein